MISCNMERRRKIIYLHILILMLIRCSEIFLRNQALIHRKTNNFFIKTEEKEREDLLLVQFLWTIISFHPDSVVLTKCLHLDLLLI